MEDLGALADIIFIRARRMGQSNRFDRMFHTLELKLRPFEVSPYVCIGSHAFAMFSAHAVREGRGHARTVT